MKTLTAALMLLLSSFVLMPQANASDPVPMPPQVSVGGKNLHLNGQGLRKATLLRVKVYEAGLYLPHQAKDAQQIVNSPDTKVVRLKFLRDVTRTQVQDAWRDGLQKNCTPNCERLQNDFSRFIAAMPAAKDGDTFVYIISNDGVRALRNGQLVVANSNPALGKAVLSTWLGKEPPNEDLKLGMLGLKQEKIG